MDFMDILFNKNRPFEPAKISGGTTNGRVAAERGRTVAKILETSDREMIEDDLAMIRQKLHDNIKTSMKTFDCHDDGHDDDIYKKYNFNRRSQLSTQLPIYGCKEKIMSKIRQYPSVVIEGSTGCGKSTQIPQMILDDAREHGKACNIIVTQPRRIAAKSIADRVVRERGWDLGTVVGYQIGLDKRFVSEDTRITFVTTGILLEKLIHSKSLTQFSHIVLDEVHERNKEMDFLFVILRILWSQSINIKVILMSATIDTVKFAEYFRFFQFDHWVPAPIVKVDQKSLYTVKEFYLDDIKGLPVPEIHWKQPGITDEMYKLALLLITNIKGIDRETDTGLSSILIFLPGIYEIGRFRTKLMEYAQSKCDLKWRIFILHSLISTEEQQLIFEPVENNVRKIILSTNIAESSITVPDVKYVIDFCLMKYLKSDTTKNFTSLEMDWAAKNNCKQRAGRAGRVANGRCYRLVKRRFFECYMAESATPEILLTPLENVILKAKTFEMEAPYTLLGLAMDAPDMDDIANTVLTLKELGALHLTVQNSYSAMDGDMTFLGHIMSNLPIDVRATRLIALGYCFGVLEECIIMAAGLTTKSIFKITFERDLSEYSRRLEWSNGSGSDLFAILNAYKIWNLKYNQKDFGRNKEEEKKFCNRHYLDLRSLNECHQLVLELTQRLEKLGIRQATGVDRIRWTEQEKGIILKVVCSGAFYPHFFATPPINNPMVERDAFHSLNGRDPDNTVFFTGFRQENIRPLYSFFVRALFQNTVVAADNINSVKVSFDANSEKVFITFEGVSQGVCSDNQNDWDTKLCSIPGKTLTEVYKAVKMRKMNMPTRIPLMKPDREKQVAEKMGLGFMETDSFIFKGSCCGEIRNICIPKTTEKEVMGTVTHVENCSTFWFQPIDERQRIEYYNQELNNDFHSILAQPKSLHTLSKTEIIVARDHADGKLYRAQLTSSEGTVYFLDSGRRQKCQLDDIYVFTRQTEQATMPPRCFQCRLSEISPSTANLSGGNMWDHEAIKVFKSFVIDREVKAEIYSVVNGTANVFIFANGTNLNNILIDRYGYGEFSEENFLSKNNHWKRQHLQNLIAVEGQTEDTLNFADCDEYYPIANCSPIMPLEDRYYDRAVQLKGPKSPLESAVHSVLLHNGKRSVNIDAHSVNSVLLTSLQQDLSIKYMVAAHMSQQGGSNKELVIHQTTLLPSIRGFGPLMAMVFCKQMGQELSEE
ncbi:probable ATP-dependent RNA helicase spindle-E [Sitodiplosis mosellana]|uniref:probable ATP-dependent RNA helicase spindle-E n=1 Tax=Sitodiplosis mosellana TaxID=263140 RepID=UPI002444735C|nr:probable ATP-dependent RNA helicase spindle-E [Sitodiplosis mosellana]